MADKAGLLALDARTLRDRLASGAVKALDLAEACIARIEAREPDVQAWAWVDPDFARHQARALDAHRQAGRPIGPLHGLPVGLKDIIDTAKIPTENGCAQDAGRVPIIDAALVARLKAAGAVIMGKTVTTELAFLQPGKTRNPHNPAHTPGGSSSGSAAAVADGMVPLAIGTQTGGSVIRPASYCGITGYKPSFGAIPRTGVLMQSPTLDTVGVFARTPCDAAMFAEALWGHDAGDTATSPEPAPRLEEVAASDPPIRPLFAFVKPPGWEDADPQLHAAFDELTGTLGDQVFEVTLPRAFEEAAGARADQPRGDGALLLPLRQGAGRARPPHAARRSPPATRSSRATTSRRSTGRTCSMPGSRRYSTAATRSCAPPRPAPPPRVSSSPATRSSTGSGRCWACRR